MTSDRLRIRLMARVIRTQLRSALAFHLAETALNAYWLDPSQSLALYCTDEPNGLSHGEGGGGGMTGRI